MTVDSMIFATVLLGSVVAVYTVAYYWVLFCERKNNRVLLVVSTLVVLWICIATLASPPTLNNSIIQESE
jgi:hypothetical protein